MSNNLSRQDWRQENLRKQTSVAMPNLKIMTYLDQVPLSNEISDTD